MRYLMAVYFLLNASIIYGDAVLLRGERFGISTPIYFVEIDSTDMSVVGFAVDKMGCNKVYEKTLRMQKTDSLAYRSDDLILMRKGKDWFMKISNEKKFNGKLRKCNSKKELIHLTNCASLTNWKLKDEDSLRIRFGKGSIVESKYRGGLYKLENQIDTVPPGTFEIKMSAYRESFWKSLDSLKK